MTHRFPQLTSFVDRIKAYVCFGFVGLAVSTMVPLEAPSTWSEYVSSVEYGIILLVVAAIFLWSKSRPSAEHEVKVTVTDDVVCISRRETTKIIQRDSLGKIVRTLNREGETVQLVVSWPGHRIGFLGCEQMDFLDRLITTNLSSMAVETRRRSGWMERWDTLGVGGPAVWGLAVAVLSFALLASFNPSTLMILYFVAVTCLFVGFVIGMRRMVDPDERRFGRQLQLLTLLLLVVSAVCVAGARYLGI